MAGLSIVLVGIFVFSLISWILRRSASSLPPGPIGWPLLGSIPTLVLEYYRLGRPSPHELLAKLGTKYGKLFSIWLGPKLVVVANDLQTIREAGQNPLTAARPKQIASNTDGQGVALCSGEVWLQQRRFTLSTLRSFGVGKKSFEEQISEESSHLMDEFKGSKGRSFDPKFLLLNATSNVLCSVIFGKRYGYSDSDFRYLLKIMDLQVRLAGSGGSGVFLPLQKYLPKSKEQRENEMMSTDFKSFLSKIVEEHRRNFDSENLKDYIDVYLKEMELSRDVTSQLTKPNLLATLSHLFFAGTDTSATTLRWALMYMIDHPDIQMKVHKELDHVVGRDRLPKLSDRQDLPYTDAVIHEVSRIGTVSTLAVPHYSSSDTKIRGYDIPKETVILFNLWAWHNDPEVWEDPAVFKPERFLDGEGVLQKTDNVIPFSVGRRQCIGEQLARKEMFIFFAHLMHRFTFRKANDDDVLNFTGMFGITNAPFPYEIRAFLRE